MANKTQPSAYVKNVLQNGVGRYVCQLQRLTLNFCKSRNESRGMRDFIENDLMDFTKDNPGIVVYLKPRRHRQPRVVATYLNGNTHITNVNNMGRIEVCKWVELSRQRSGVDIARLRKKWHTEVPTVQGTWHPFLNKDTSISTKTFPDDQYAEKEMVDTLSDRLLQMAENLRKMKLENGQSSNLHIESEQTKQTGSSSLLT